MRHDPEYLTFDCYGTLIDWETGIAEAFMKAAAASKVQISREDVLRLHADAEPKVQAEGYRTYREVLAETAVRMAKEIGWQLEKAKAEFLANSLPSWKPFPDTNSGLKRLTAAGIKLGILSNIDDDLLKGTLKHFSVTFDPIVTAQQVKSYKPAQAHFEEARKQLDGKHWLHAAQSYFHDVEPSIALGIPVVWVNRKHERARGEARPDAEVDTITGLADLLGAD